MAQDTAMLLITCSCGQRMKVPAAALGKSATCVRCGERLRISIETTDPSEETASQTNRAERGAPLTKEPASIHILRQHGLVNEAAVEEARRVQQDIPDKLWQLLIELGHVSSEGFHAIMAKQKGTAGIDLLNYNIQRDVKNAVAPEVARHGVVMPVDKLGKLLTLAMACPTDTEVIAEVEKHTGLKVKSMLSNYSDLKKSIQANYPALPAASQTDDPFTEELHREFRPLLESNEVARRIFALDSLGPFAQTSLRLKSTDDASTNGSTLRTVTEIVALDPVATALLLRVSNSEAYGFPQRVDGLGLACTLLGPEATRNIVCSVACEDYFSRTDGFDYQAFWTRAQFCSEAAQNIAGAAGSSAAITAYTAALLHQLGQLALVAAVPKSYGGITKGQHGIELAKTEKRVYHITSAEAGYLLARKWNLPPNLSEPIRYHRQPQKAQNATEVTQIVALAALMADAHGSGEPLALDRVQPLVAALGIALSDIADVFSETSESIATQAGAR